MRRNTYIFLILSFLILGCNINSPVKEQSEDLPYDDSKDKNSKVAKEQRIADRFKQEWEMTHDPATGKIPVDALSQSRAYMNRKMREKSTRNPIANINWEERGPNNIGGRTRATLWDPEDSANGYKKVYAGGVGGGLWVTTDITATNVIWNRVDDFWDNLAISSIAYDEVNEIYYVGTGEGFGNIDAIRGGGIWKSDDGGSTWSVLSATTGYRYINELKTYDGIVVASTWAGVKRSTDGGNTWTDEVSGQWADIEVASNGDMYVSNYSGDVRKSTDQGNNWTEVLNLSERRVEIATAPSNSNYIYALVGDGSNIGAFKRSTNGGNSWTDVNVPLYKSQSCVNSTSDFTRGQSWYDLTIAVDPADEDVIIVGGVDLHRSQDGGQTWSSISYWTGACDAYVHADIHDVNPRPGNPDHILVGCDGGVYYSTDAFATNSNPTFAGKNAGYNITQYYGGDIHPATGSPYLIAGAQDNGTQVLEVAGLTSGRTVTGGDGAFSHIDQDEPLIQLSAYVYNNVYVSTNGFGPGTQSYQSNTGRFINPSDYDNLKNALYSAWNGSNYGRISSIGGNAVQESVPASNFPGTATTVAVSPNVEDRVYFGFSSNRIVRVDQARSNAPVETSFTLPTSGAMSCIEVEHGNEDHILVSLSNYGVNSIWESTDGGSSFSSIEGNLPDMPVRWILLDPRNNDRAIIATELGVWSTDNINGGSTDWDPTNAGLSNTRVDMIQYRRSDFGMAAFTHGRGIFTTDDFACNDPGDCYGDDMCRIENVAIGEQICNAVNGTYTQEVTFTLYDTPSSGSLSINGQNVSFPFSTQQTTINVTLIDLVPDGNSVDLNFSYSDGGCGILKAGAFTAPANGCIPPNEYCEDAFVITETGTYETNGPSSGNGCGYCQNATHADWWKFTAPCNGTIDVASCFQGVDTRVIIHTGDCNNLNFLVGNDDICEMTQGGDAYASQLSDIPVTEGTTYYIEWDNRWSGVGFSFDFEFTPTGACEPAGCAGQTYLVVDPSATGDGTGCDWDNAVTDLSAAIDMAQDQQNITEIWIKGGSYKPEGSDRNASFAVNTSVELIGGFAGTETNKSQRDPINNVTYLSGNINTQQSASDNVYHVVTITGGVEVGITDLVIEDGYADGTGSGANGGGLSIEGNATLTNVKIRNCYASGGGSAISVVSGTSIIVLEDVDCIEGNSGPTCAQFDPDGNITIKGLVNID